MENIKKFYRKNKWISRIGIKAFVISLLYMTARYMLGHSWEEPACSWFYNLSISYIAATIFYVVQVYIKEEKEEKKFMACMKNKFAEITKYIELAILVYDKHVIINDTGANLLWNGKGEKGENKLYIKYLSNRGKAPMYKSYTEDEILLLGEKFRRKIAEIRNNPIIKFCDYELLELLTKIEDRNLFGNINLLIRLADTQISLKNLNGIFMDIKALSDRINKICGIDRAYYLEEVNDTDRFYADISRRNLSEDFKTIVGFNKKTLRLLVRDKLKGVHIKMSEQDLNTVVETIVEAILEDIKKDKSSR